MDSSRRAVESYWRSRMIDGATSDEDKVTPVYKLEEVCELLRSSHVSIVKEVSEFILKRLEHKSPIVKQKALRLIKYAVGKSGSEFRREMQRNSVAVRQLLHYKGQLDPLKGDALNKAVRDTTQETISAIFSAEDNKPAPSEDINKRIQGFGSTNYEMPASEDKKSFLSEVVGLGSATLKQGFGNFTQGNSSRKNDPGTYRSPNLRRSLTIENGYDRRYESAEYHNEGTQGSFGILKNVSSGPKLEVTNGVSSSSFSENKSREERLLETIATSGGVRLQPSRDAIQAFLMEAAHFDALALSRAIESKLKSPLWQVRMKAVCVLESILRKSDDEHFVIVASYFTENQDAVIRCSESPQASLREKANKVLALLGGEQTGTIGNNSEKAATNETSNVYQMPDLIDTGDPSDYNGTEESIRHQSDQNIAKLNASATPLIDDLFGDGMSSGLSTSEPKNDDDPFSDVSFHTTENRDRENDLFSGLSVDDKREANENHMAGKKDESNPFDIFGSNLDPLKPEPNGNGVDNLMSGLSIHEDTSKNKGKGNSPGELSETLFADANSQSNRQNSNDALNGIFSPQLVGMNANAMFPQGAMAYNIPPDMMLNPAFAQPINYGAVGNLLAQQQFLATMSSFQQNGNPQNAGAMGGGFPSPFPDIFQPNFSNQPPTSMMNGSKKEETRAFNFISDHLSATRDLKRIV